MEYFEYVVLRFFDALEDFFKIFNIVSGKTSKRVLLFGFIYLFISLVSEVSGMFTFVDYKSALLAVVILFIINCISSVQRKDIEEFKKMLKGDDCTYD